MVTKQRTHIEKNGFLTMVEYASSISAEVLVDSNFRQTDFMLFIAPNRVRDFGFDSFPIGETTGESQPH